MLQEVVLTEEFSSVTVLDLSYTDVTVLETTVATELVEVRAEYSSLTSWEDITLSSTVEVLNIAGNELTDWSAAELPTSLRELYVCSLCGLHSTAMVEVFVD